MGSLATIGYKDVYMLCHYLVGHVVGENLISFPHKTTNLINIII